MQCVRYRPPRPTLHMQFGAGLLDCNAKALQAANHGFGNSGTQYIAQCAARGTEGSVQQCPVRHGFIAGQGNRAAQIGSTSVNFH